MLNFNQVADVLEKVATLLDTQEATKQAALKSEKKAYVEKLATKYVETTGEELPENIQEKLASSDEEVVEFLRSTIEKNSEALQPLGGPSLGNKTARNSVAAAEERFLDWITS